MAKTFKMVGMCEEAVAVFCKSGFIQEAVNTCVYLNQWSLAVELAQKHQIKVSWFQFTIHHQLFDSFRILIHI